MSRTYGRRQPFPLSVEKMLVRVSATVPTSVDLRQWCGPIKDQGSEGSCTAHAGTSANEWIHRKYLNSSPVFSPQYVYAQELIAQGNFPDDEGSDGTILCETLIYKGSCEASVYPYVPGKILEPTPEQIANALKYKLGAFHGLTSSRVATTVLGNPVPWPVEVGFTVYASFESEETATTGIYNPRVSEQVLGGHEVLMVGYDIGPTPIIRPASCPPAALIQNSWGSSWGLGGFFWMVMPVLDDPQTDLKIVHSGGPWK